MTAPRRLLGLMVLGFALAGAGCRSAPCNGDVPPVPPATSSSAFPGGGLLQTGAINLGPGLAQNWYRWTGDGQWGFPQQ